jgi:hypothetical protein
MLPKFYLFLNCCASGISVETSTTPTDFSFAFLSPASKIPT